MTIVKGLDTIRNLVGQPPEIISIDKKELTKAQLAIISMNPSFIALIPFCYKCKEPLDWIVEESTDGRIFICPKCGREWIKGEGW